MPNSFSMAIIAADTSSIGSFRARVFPAFGEFTSVTLFVSIDPGYDEPLPEPISAI